MYLGISGKGMSLHICLLFALYIVFSGIHLSLELQSALLKGTLKITSNYFHYSVINLFQILKERKPGKAKNRAAAANKNTSLRRLRLGYSVDHVSQSSLIN